MGILLLWILAAALVAYSLMLVFLSNLDVYKRQVKYFVILANDERILPTCRSNRAFPLQSLFWVL